MPSSRPSSTHRLAFPDAVVGPLVSLIERILCSARWTSYDSSAIPCSLQPPPMNPCICSEENRFPFPQRQSSEVSRPPNDALSLVSVLNHRGGFEGRVVRSSALEAGHLHSLVVSIQSQQSWLYVGLFKCQCDSTGRRSTSRNTIDCRSCSATTQITASNGGSGCC